jgi:uncharacterized OB-fold protein
VHVSEGDDVTLRTVAGRDTAESLEDLTAWVRGLQGCPPVTHTVAASCRLPMHEGEPATWFYIEADAAAGVARTRCLSCGDVHPLLDSAERWTFPPAWSCFNCRQSIAEVAYGVSAEDDRAQWVVMAVRCVECGHLAGVTDQLVPGLPMDDVLEAL